MPTLRATEIFNAAGTKLIAVASFNVHQCKTAAICQLHGNITPIAVIVCRREGIYALDINAKPTDIERLRQNVPELATLVPPLSDG